ncbi:MAG TPA: glycosyl hydrolase family 28-related protein, partial [Bacteroidia bacterium]|nr:glycosyl hydrolase family 28-related protein [Bacteroidia bacterium]
MKKVSAAWLVAGISAMGLPGRSSGGEGPIRFPADAGIVDVTEYGAVPGDEFDDTEAIQAALDTFPNGNRIVYLPPGTYRISDTLRWPGGGESAMQRRTILQGAGEGETLLRLPEATAGFTDAVNPKPLIWTGGAPAQRYRNAIRDLAVEIGPGNAGAVGVQLAASGQGGMRRVTIRAAQGSGRIGLDLSHADEIGPLLVKHLVVEGFETGIATKWPLNSNTFEHVHLAGQRRQGWWNYHQMVFVRDLVSENRVPSLYNEKDSWGAVTLLGAHLHALRPEPGTPAILNQRQMYLRDVEILGYPKGVDHDDRGREKGDIEGPGTVAEDTSHREVRSLFREVGDGTFAEAGEVVHL